MNEVILLSIEKTKDKHFWWAIDKDTYCLIKLQVNDIDHKAFELGTVLSINSSICNTTIPKFTDVSFVETERVETEIKNILDIKSAYPGDEDNELCEGRVIKVSKVLNLVNSANSVGIVCCIYGIEDKSFQVNITDARWVNYWNENRRDFELVQDEIVRVLNHKRDKYLITDYGLNQFSTVINCGGMVIVNG